ncbi:MULTISPECIES: hypothetical protein [unclassified Microbacterium]|uniref:hypothetical protein n=1 Tax=unclassified Microbacterium TaxID=2609290 RepID=UPI0012FB8EF5|nr:hypothetical protein [Microbacterium sp. MAH-37]MVQ44111.1 hypothetical protein [Microbacterium sp. MAH-37]
MTGTREAHEPEHRLQYFGQHDLSSGWQAGEAAAIVRAFDGSSPPGNVTDLIELHHAHQFVQAGFVPRTLTDEEMAELNEKSSRIRGAVARFFTEVNSSNLDARIQAVPFQYRSDVLTLLGNNRAFERCGAAQMLPLLLAQGFRVGELIENKKLVSAYDPQVRELMIEDPRNAELLIEHHFGRDRRRHLYIPSSLTPADARDLMSRYLQAPEANGNYVALIEAAPITKDTGVDAKLKLDAKRRKARDTKAFFENNEGIRTGVEVSIVGGQEGPALSTLDGMVIHLSYSREWLEQTTDPASVLNHFQHLFEFADENVLLTLPSYKAELGTLEGLFTSVGRTDYHMGAAYRIRDMSSTVQTQLTLDFLRDKGIDLESVIAWFFQEYLPVEFGADGFTFSPSNKESGYLEKTRNLLSEMESVVRQFDLFVADGEIDRELLTITSDTVRYKHIPTLNDGKYLYATDAPEIQQILHALFSDQSLMGYLREELHEDTLTQVLLRHTVAYSDFLDVHRGTLDHLIGLGILQREDEHVRVASIPQLLILSSLWAREAASYCHLPAASRSLADEMVERGWLRRSATLLTAAEAGYFNFHLNKAEFFNGPEIRNKYLHGTQADADGPQAHFDAYISALKLTLALVIKINDDFALKASSPG